MNSEHGVDVDELINEHSRLRLERDDLLDKLKIVSLLHNHKIVQINELEEEIKSLQCCMNCMNYRIGWCDGSEGWCNIWSFDSLTREKRKENENNV